MRTTAKVFWNRRSQLVRLPKGFHFRAGEVYLRREGDSVLLSQRPLDWSGFLGEELAVSDRFMESLPESLVDVS